MKQRHSPEEGNPQLYAVENLRHENDVVRAVMIIVNILMTMERTVTVIRMLVVVTMTIMVMMVMLMAIKNVLIDEIMIKRVTIMMEKTMTVQSIDDDLSS